MLYFDVAKCCKTFRENPPYPLIYAEENYLLFPPIYISAVSVYATKTYWEEELQFHSFLNLALGGVSGQFYAAPALVPEGITKDTGFYLRAGGPESRCGRFGEGRQPRTPAEI